jgi:hypothetical protein
MSIEEKRMSIKEKIKTGLSALAILAITYGAVIMVFSADKIFGR